MTCLGRARVRRGRDYPLAAALISRHFIVLTGPTGCGKTAVLRRMILAGAQALDLEALAVHRGSVFGGFNGCTQPNKVEFVQRITRYLRTMTPARPIWVEDKGSRLGDLAIPEPLWTRVREADAVVLRCPVETRIRNLASEYGATGLRGLAQHLRGLRSRLSTQDMDRAERMLSSGDLQSAIGVVLPYYDAAYAKPDSARILESIDVDPTKYGACVAHLVGGFSIHPPEPRTSRPPYQLG